MYIYLAIYYYDDDLASHSLEKKYVYHAQYRAARRDPSHLRLSMCNVCVMTHVVGGLEKTSCHKDQKQQKGPISGSHSTHSFTADHWMMIDN